MQLGLLGGDLLEAAGDRREPACATTTIPLRSPITRSPAAIAASPIASGRPTSPGPLGKAEFGVTPRQKQGMPSATISSASRAMPSVTIATAPRSLAIFAMLSPSVAVPVKPWVAIHQDVARLDQVGSRHRGEIVARPRAGGERAAGEAARRVEGLDLVVERAAAVHGIEHKSGRALAERRELRCLKPREPRLDDELGRVADLVSPSLGRMALGLMPPHR